MNLCETKDIISKYCQDYVYFLDLYDHDLDNVFEDINYSNIDNDPIMIRKNDIPHESEKGFIIGSVHFFDSGYVLDISQFSDLKRKLQELKYEKFLEIHEKSNIYVSEYDADELHVEVKDYNFIREIVKKFLKTNFFIKKKKMLR